MEPLTVAFVLFEGCDVMDVTGPYEVVLTADRLAVRDGGAPPFTVVLAAPDGRPVTGYGGLGLVPTAGLDALADADVVVVPGMIDLDAALAMDGLIGALARLPAAAHPPVVASVCTGAFLLDAAGLLGDRPATTHWEDVAALRARRGPDAGPTVDDVRWVDADDVVTGGGISSGVDMALHLVARFAGRDLAERTATQMDHVWTQSR